MSAEDYLARQEAILAEYRRVRAETPTQEAEARAIALRKLQREIGLTPGDAIRALLPEQKRRPR